MARFRGWRQHLPKTRFASTAILVFGWPGAFIMVIEQAKYFSILSGSRKNASEIEQEC